MTRSGLVARDAAKRLTILVLLAAGFLASSPRSGNGQGVRVIGEGVARPVAGSVTGAMSDPQRFRKPPRSAVDLKIRAGTAIGSDPGRPGAACASPSLRVEARGCEIPNEAPGRAAHPAGERSVLQAGAR